MPSFLLFYATLFVTGLGLHFVATLFALAALQEDGHGFAQWLAKIGLVAAYRPVLTVNASNEVSLKRRSYDEQLDTEKVTFGGLTSKVTRYLRDPQDRLHRFLGVRFGFVDERTGLVFDPRDSDAGGRSREHNEAGSLKYSGEPENGRIPQYIRGVLGFQKGARGVRLRDVQHIIGGSADSQAVDWLVDLYKKSQEPRSSQMSIWKLLAPVGALIGVLVVGAFISGNTGGGGGGGGGPNVTQPVGGMLALLVSTSQLPFSTDRQRIVAAVFGLVGVLAVGGLFLLFPTFVAWPATISLVLGIVFLPAVTYFLGRSLGALGMGLAKLYLILAFFPYDDPVIHLRADDEYTIAELDDLENVSDPERYRFAKTWVGMTYENTEDAWPGRNSVLDKDTLENKSEAETTPDGIPPDQALASSTSSGGHSGVVPKRPKSDRVYVQTRHTWSWFKEVGRGQLLKRALKNAKGDHFGGQEDQDDRILYMTVAFAVLGLIVDVMVFF